MTGSVVLDSAAGRGRSPATMPGFHRGRPPRNKGLQFPADPPTVGGDRRGHALRRRPTGWAADPRVDRVAVARGPAYQRGAVAGRDRSRRLARQHCRSQGERRAAPRGRISRMGVAARQQLVGDTPWNASRGTLVCDRRRNPRPSLVGDRGSRHAKAPRARRRRPQAVRAAPAPACSCRRPASISRGSTAARSSTPFIVGQRRFSRPAQGSGKRPGCETWRACALTTRAPHAWRRRRVRSDPSCLPAHC